MEGTKHGICKEIVVFDAMKENVEHLPLPLI